MIEKYLYYLDENSRKIGSKDISYPDKDIENFTEEEISDLLEKGYNKDSLDAGRLFYSHNPNESTMVNLNVNFDENIEYVFFNKENQIWEKRDIMLEGFYYSKIDASLETSIAKKNLNNYVQKTEVIQLHNDDTLKYNSLTNDIDLVKSATRIANELANELTELKTQKLTTLAQDLSNLELLVLMDSRVIYWSFNEQYKLELLNAVNEAKSMGSITLKRIKQPNGSIFSVTVPFVVLEWLSYTVCHIYEHNRIKYYKYYDRISKATNVLAVNNAYTEWQNLPRRDCPLDCYNIISEGDETRDRLCLDTVNNEADYNYLIINTKIDLDQMVNEINLLGLHDYVDANGNLDISSLTEQEVLDLRVQGFTEDGNKGLFDVKQFLSFYNNLTLNANGKYDVFVELI